MIIAEAHSADMGDQESDPAYLTAHGDAGAGHHGRTDDGDEAQGFDIDPAGACLVIAEG